MSSRVSCVLLARAAHAATATATNAARRPSLQLAKRPLFTRALFGGVTRAVVNHATTTQHPFAQRHGATRSMFIQTESTPNPLSLKFLPGKVVLDERFTTGIDFTANSEETRLSPLAKNLFDIGGISRVFFGKDFVSVTKQEDEDWDTLKPIIFSTIMDFYTTGEPVVREKPLVTDTTILPEDDEVVAMIKELLEARVRPSVQEDGGDIFYRGFDPETGIVSLQMAGSCAGCPSSSVTLKNGVENMLKHYIPEVKGIHEVEDEELKKLNSKEFQTLEERLRALGIPSE